MNRQHALTPSTATCPTAGGKTVDKTRATCASLKNRNRRKTMKKPDTQPARTRIRISGERGRITRMTISGRSAPAQNKTPQTAQ